MATGSTDREPFVVAVDAVRAGGGRLVMACDDHGRPGFALLDEDGSTVLAHLSAGDGYAVFEIRLERGGPLVNVSDVLRAMMWGER